LMMKRPQQIQRKCSEVWRWKLEAHPKEGVRLRVGKSGEEFEVEDLSLTAACCKRSCFLSPTHGPWLPSSLRRPSQSSCGHTVSHAFGIYYHLWCDPKSLA
jgi:DNA-directed RNA polymerase subunit N (RpoN/RPB10)